MKENFIYIIGPTGGPIKIGIAEDCSKRRSTLNVGNHLYLRLWHSESFETEDKAKETEKFLHWSFQNFHIRGEWFSLDESKIADIRQQIYNSKNFKIPDDEWSLAKKSCDEFTAEVCAKARRSLDLTVESLAEKAELRKQTLANFENKDSLPNVQTIDALKSALEREGIEFVLVAPGSPLKILV